MIPYGLTKRKNKVHPHNECDVCCGFVGKEEGRSKARAEKKGVLRDEIQNFFDEIMRDRL